MRSLTSGRINCLGRQLKQQFFDMVLSMHDAHATLAKIVVQDWIPDDGWDNQITIMDRAGSNMSSIFDATQICESGLHFN